ncbi:hypothetical protein E2C01_042714 [Portunus trituberculatus]|uniref:Uncharacterized protein n=1 Tax=Portunus trituberculatus TaxID=210409 RepID=A0A5B7FU50_PORTR|nr:hypothetical protein [Portunus trituberculatus]
MEPLPFYDSCTEEDFDEDLIPSNVSESSSSEESDESRETEDNGTDEAETETDDGGNETEETDDDFAPASSLAPVESDNTDVDDPPDPLFKLKPLATAIRDQCQAVYKPGPMFVIDEYDSLQRES